MQNNECVKNLIERRSVKSYGPDPVTDEELDTILNAASYSPSGMGKQPVIMVAVQSKKVRDQLSRMNAKFMGNADFDPFYGAPTVVVVLADRASYTYLYDGSIVLGNLLNAAHAIGVDSCWIHRAKEEFDSEEGKALLKEWGIEGDYEGIGHCILGHIRGDYPQAKERREGRIIRIKD